MPTGGGSQGGGVSTNEAHEQDALHHITIENASSSANWSLGRGERCCEIASKTDGYGETTGSTKQRAFAVHMPGSVGLVPGLDASAITPLTLLLFLELPLGCFER